MLYEGTAPPLFGVSHSTRSSARCTSTLHCVTSARHCGGWHLRWGAVGHARPLSALVMRSGIGGTGRTCGCGVARGAAQVLEHGHALHAVVAPGGRVHVGQRDAAGLQKGRSVGVEGALDLVAAQAPDAVLFVPVAALADHALLVGGRGWGSCSSAMGHSGVSKQSVVVYQIESFCWMGSNGEGQKLWHLPRAGCAVGVALATRDVSPSVCQFAKLAQFVAVLFWL